jgi:hypothetical protein
LVSINFAAENKGNFFSSGPLKNIVFNRTAVHETRNSTTSFQVLNNSTFGISESSELQN